MNEYENVTIKGTKKGYYGSKLVLTLIFLLVIAVCVQSFYIIKLNVELNYMANPIPFTGIIEQPGHHAVNASNFQKIKNEQLQEATTSAEQKEFTEAVNNVKAMENNNPVTQVQPNFITSYSGSSFQSNQKEYIFTVSMPNLNKENTKVTAEDGILTVTGKNEQGSKTANSSALSSQQFSESIVIPSDVDQSKISATVTGNSLVVTLPKTESK